MESMVSDGLECKGCVSSFLDLKFGLDSYVCLAIDRQQVIILLRNPVTMATKVVCKPQKPAPEWTATAVADGEFVKLSSKQFRGMLVKTNKQTRS
jgi:hypothetical protein